MPIKEKDFKRYSAILLVIFLVIMAFLIIRPILMSVVAGLILSYIFLPVYKFIYKIFRERTTSALAVCLLVVLVIFIPLWFLVPIIIRQLFDMFTLFQSLDISGFIRQFVPNLPAQVQVDLSSTVASFIGKITTSSLTSLTSVLVDLPNVLLHLTIVIFVFFFGMRDSDKLVDYVSELSPLKKDKGVLIAQQFKQLTNSIVYGHFIIGVAQGILAGIGFLIFGLPRALLLTLLSIFAAVLPIIGPWLVWIPAAIYLFSIGHTGAAIGLTIYCVLVVSTTDNIMRLYIVSRKTKSSSVVILVGMLGGLIAFGVLGLVIGPLILEYVVLFLDAYKSKTLGDLFDSD